MKNPEYSLLGAAIRQVPAVRYALGIAGVVAAVALATAFISDVVAALLSAAVMLGLMVLLLVFSHLVASGDRLLRLPAMFLVWTMLFLFSGSASLVASSVFIGWPRSFGELVSDLFESVGGAPLTGEPPAATPPNDDDTGGGLRSPPSPEQQTGPVPPADPIPPIQ